MISYGFGRKQPCHTEVLSRLSSEETEENRKPGLIRYYVSQPRIEIDVSCIQLYNTS